MRKQYIEYLRVIAMLAVIAIHVCITALNGFDNESIGEGTLYFSIRNLFHFAVPVFFMITGALMLAPEKELPIKKLIKRYIIKYGSVILLFCWLFALIEEVFNYKTFTINMFGSSFMNMLQGKSWNHMWYMYTLFGVMLIVPVLRAIAVRFGKNEIKFFIFVAAVFLSVLPLVNALTGFSFGVSIPLSSIYCVYMMLGYWLDNKDIKIPKRICIIGIGATTVVIIILSFLRQAELAKTAAWVEYSSPLIALFSVCVFGLAKNIKIREKTPRIICFLGECSFGVYIVHMFWINIVYKVLKFNPFRLNAVLGFVVVYIVVTVASILSAAIMRKIPILKKLV